MFGSLLNFAGGFLDRSSGRSGQKKQFAQQAHFDELSYQRQKEFAQRGIQWRVDDAKKAGLHPLYALGGVGASYSSPSFIPGQAETGSHMSSALGSIGRGVDKYLQRPNAYERQQTRYERRLAQKEVESRIQANRALSMQRVADVQRRSVAPGQPATMIDSAFGPAVRVDPVKPEAIKVVPPTVQRPLPPNVVTNFMGLGDLTLGPGASAGDVEDRGGEFMGLLHSIGQTFKALGADAWDELKWLGTFGKKGSPPWKWR